MNANHLDIIKRVLELAHTAEEGLNYITNCSNQGELSKAIGVLADFVQAFQQIESSLNILPESAGIEKLRNAGNGVKGILIDIGRFCDEEKWQDAEKAISLFLADEYRVWKSILEQTLVPLIAS
ncbi:MAG: hypothetical protein ACM3NT_06395 [Methylocystaceae bacterium]